MSETLPRQPIELAVDIVSAYVSNNSVHSAELPTLIHDVHTALQNALAPAPAAPEEKASPAVAVKRSITPDHLISLIDGRKYRTLKRHLGAHGLTPAQYRERYGLSPDYPMIAPNYARTRSELAKQFGLGQKGATKPTTTRKRKRS